MVETYSLFAAVQRLGKFTNTIEFWSIRRTVAPYVIKNHPHSTLVNLEVSWDQVGYWDWSPPFVLPRSSTFPSSTSTEITGPILSKLHKKYPSIDLFQVYANHLNPKKNGYWPLKSYWKIQKFVELAYNDCFNYKKVIHFKSSSRMGFITGKDSLLFHWNSDMGASLRKHLFRSTVIFLMMTATYSLFSDFLRIMVQHDFLKLSL